MVLGEIILTQPTWLVALCLAGGAGVAAILYWGASAVANPARAILACLRAVAVALLAFLLLGPLLRNVSSETQRPVLLLASDVSASAKPAIDSLADGLDALANRLSERYDVQRVSMGERVRTYDAADTSRDAATNLDALITYANDNYPSELLAGVVVATDGIYNQGADPSYAAANLVAPVYAVALGDTTPQRDLAIREVLYNQIAYLGDKLELQVDLEANGLAGSSSTVTLSSVSSTGRTQTISSEPLRIAQDRDFQTLRFEVTTQSAGPQRYRLAVSPVSGERNVLNNSRELYIDVLDARQQVLILAAAPHPDISALRQTLDAAKNYETTFALTRNFDGNVGDADLVILHDLPSATVQLTGVLAQIEADKIGKLFIAGPGGDARAINSAQQLLTINARPGQTNEVFPQLAGGFQLFSVDDTWSQALSSFPPLRVPFAEYGPLASGAALLTQRIGTVSTEYPLLAMGEVGGAKVGVLTGSGLWRWRLAEYQRSGNHDAFDGIVLATVQYLALRDDRRPFRVTPSERLYSTSDDVRFTGELYNASFELVNEPDVSVAVTDAEGTAYTYLMDKASGAYRLRAGRLPAGTYEYSASTQYAGEDYRASGSFTIRQVQLEDASATANHGLLRRLTSQQGGKTVLPANIASLADDLLADSAGRPVLYQSVQTRPLIDWPWLLAIVLVLLAAEWFVRRRLGTY